MILLMGSAAFVGFVHSLAPGHWLPVVLMAKARKWNHTTAALGALVAASGHVFLSVLIGIASVFLGTHFLSGWEDAVEKYGAGALVLFGLLYAGFSYSRHSHCHGHGHHGPHPPSFRAKGFTPFAFLFSLGFSPCIAVIPVFLAASAKGTYTVFLCMSSFSLGVVLALMGSTVIVVSGIMKLDHPLFEHHGDVVTGIGVALMGALFFLIPL